MNLFPFPKNFDDNERKINKKKETNSTTVPKKTSLMTTGIKGLDEVIQSVLPGDNIVWHINGINDYLLFVRPFCRDAYKNKKKLIYFRFASHEFLLPEDIKADVYNPDPKKGFESFISEIFEVIEKHDKGAFYVFDSLSGLSADWYSDSMLANFFMLTCPYLYDYDTATYFAIFRNKHTTQTIEAIHNTAQVVIDVFNNKNKVYIQPLKVFKRRSPTMYMLHEYQNGAFTPVTKSAVIADILKTAPHPWLDFKATQQDMWNGVFYGAFKAVQKIKEGDECGGVLKDYENYKQRLIKMVFTRDDKFFSMAEKYFDLNDLINIGRHMIGTGLIGGKAAGMLLARAILKKKNSYWKTRLEQHDSFYVGSDVFYTYLIKSGCWWLRWRQRREKNVGKADEAKTKLLNGAFPDEILNQFKEILNYFGQSPIIVRSSSLLEDAYGNSFSGKYESFFCANQGSPEERLEEFLNAVRKIYASAMDREALDYRAQRGLIDRDEQMALLIQRVSGQLHGSYFFPHIAGVGLSYNLYAWDKDIDAEAGVLRLVMGLGTRAVDRRDDDYTRICALNAPLKRVETNFNEVKKHSQRKLDLLNLKTNSFSEAYFIDIASELKGFNIEKIAEIDEEAKTALLERNIKTIPFVITFDKLLAEKKFTDDFKEILKILQKAYDYPVDIEFTVNFTEEDEWRINVLQCRPYQVKKGAGIVSAPANLKEENIILKTNGPIIGGSVHIRIDKIIYVVSENYSALPENEKYKTADIIGRINKLNGIKGKKVMLLGPGRWGTTTPALGVPVKLAQINNFSVLYEIAEMRGGLKPDISLGTHFFNDIVEQDILYMALDPSGRGCIYNKDFFNNAVNSIAEEIKDVGKFKDIIKLIDLNQNKMYLNADSISQTGVLYFKK